jgi:hypothetical protein
MPQELLVVSCRNDPARERWPNATRSVTTASSSRELQRQGCARRLQRFFKVNCRRGLHALDNRLRAEMANPAPPSRRGVPVPPGGLGIAFQRSTSSGLSPRSRCRSRALDDATDPEAVAMRFGHGPHHPLEPISTTPRTALVAEFQKNTIACPPTTPRSPSTRAAIAAGPQGHRRQGCRTEALPQGDAKQLRVVRCPSSSVRTNTRCRIGGPRSGEGSDAVR